VNGVATRVIWPPSRWAKLTSQLPCDRNPFGIHNHKDAEDNVIEQFKDDVIGDVHSKIEVESNDSQSKTKSDLVDSSKVLKNLPQNVRRHASDIAS
jgi:hypothetical protein